MKRTLLFIGCVLASWTMLAQEQLAVEDLQNSGCLWKTRGEEYAEPVPTIVLTKENSILSVQVLNYESNCSTVGFNVKNSISEGTNGIPMLTINITPNSGGLDVDCMCPYNVSFTLRDLETNTFYLKCWWYEGLVTLEDGEPLVLEDITLYATIDGLNYTLKKTLGTAMLTKVVEQKSKMLIPAEINYEGQTYTVKSVYHAFGNCTTIKTLDIPESITTILVYSFVGCKLDTLIIRGILDSHYLNNDFFSDMGTDTKVFVQPSEVEKYKAIYNGPVYPLTEAQDDSDYIPFVQEGKKWIVFRSDYETGWHLEQYMLMNEGIVKEGKTYMKMYRSEDEMDEVYDTGLFREEGRKVYIFDTDRQEELLMFDYSLKAGDTYWAHSDDEGKMVSYKVISVDDYQEGPEVIRYDYNQEGSLIKHRRYLKKWTVCRTDNESLQMIWIEGVGSLEGPLGNLHDVVLPGMTKDYLGYVEYLDYDFIYLPFSFCDTLNGQVYGCNLPTGAADHSMVFQHQLNYELEGDRLHVYGKVFTQCGPNNYAYFCERNTDDPLIHKIEFFIQEVEPTTDCRALHVTDFYVPGFDPNLNYIVVDNQGEEHPVINKNTQMAYRPFIEEGKVWTVKVISDWWPTEEWTEYYYFDGDTIVNNKNAKRMLCDKIISGQNINGEYVGAWYEQDKKVYYAANQHQQFALLYDFTLSSGDKIQAPGDYIFVVNKISGSITGFKGTYYDFWLEDYWIERWLESVGSEYWPYLNHSIDFEGNKSILLSCGVGDEIIYYNSEEEDPYVMGARKRIDFTHTIKTKPKMPRRETDTFQGGEDQLYGEYNNLQLDINLNPLDDAYLVRITDETGKAVYEKNVNAASIVGLNIDISAYAEGRYTVTVENSQESFTGVFETVTTGISDTARLNDNGERIDDNIYNLQGQRLNTLQKGLNILNGHKVYVK